VKPLQLLDFVVLGILFGVFESSNPSSHLDMDFEAYFLLQEYLFSSPIH
jgi:hypothetical protein